MEIEPIGVISSCYKEKFGIPRQPALVPLGKASLIMAEGYQQQEMLDGLAEFSHIWLIFGFHATLEQGWKASVRPPRLGGNKRVGVFASRSMYRPNGLGLSVCKLDSISTRGDKVALQLSGVDMLDATPVYDIKPYLPYADCLPGAVGGYADKKPAIQYEVIFSALAKQQCLEKQQELGVDVMALIQQILQQDPRPAFHAGRYQKREYGMRLYDMNVRWCYLLSGEEKIRENKELVKVISLC